MIKVYLCGPINGCSNSECRDWREEAKLFFPNATDPMCRDYRGAELASYREIVELDKLAIRKSDAVLARLHKPSIGSAMEIHYAWTLGIPVVVWVDSLKIVSPWLRYHSTSIRTSIEEAAACIRRIP